MCGSGRDEEPSGEEALRLIQIRLATLNFEKISLARQGNLPQMRIGELFGGLDYAAVAQRIRRIRSSHDSIAARKLKAEMLNV
jgi:hypothetical protein